MTSVKPNTSASRASRTSSGPDGSLRAINTNVRGLILQAYGLLDYQLVGGPDWINTARFDVEGKAPSGLFDPDVLAMTQSLLSERFQLKAHRETRELPVFTLTVGKDGPKLRKIVEGRAGPGSLGPGQSRTNATSAGGEFSGNGIGIAKLIEMLVTQVGRPIVDQTNLMGEFDIRLKWSAESIFTAIEEQLGLKLQAGKAPIEVFAIDRIEKPSEN